MSGLPCAASVTGTPVADERRAAIRAERRRAREVDYGPARVGVAIGFSLTLIALLFIDAANEHYVLDPPTLGFLLTSIAVLLGVEGLRFFRGE